VPPNFLSEPREKRENLIRTPDNLSESTKAFIEEDAVVIKWNSGDRLYTKPK
jgi:hypothetical protein